MITDLTATVLSVRVVHDFDFSVNSDQCYAAGVLSSSALHTDPRYTPINMLERVELLMTADAAKKLKRVTLKAGGESRQLDFSYAAATKRLVVRAPKVAMSDDWTITFA